MTGPTAAPGESVTRARELRIQYARIRPISEHLCQGLSPEDCTVQSMRDASPAKWHLAHTTWFFETFVLASSSGYLSAFHPQFRVLFNSYYHSVGDRHPRAERGLLTRPSLQEVLAYRRSVDEQMLSLLGDEANLPDDVAGVIELGLHHEQQHQELLLTDIKHLLSRNAMKPAYANTPELADAPAPALSWQTFEGGLVWVGHHGSTFAFDNERPRHRAFLHAFELASRPVTNGEYRTFVEEGGYERPEWWLSDGWDAARSQHWYAPLYWERHEDGWYQHTLGGLRAVREGEPVCHVSFYEADAYARWLGARLPSETEWERASEGSMTGGNFQESGYLHPTVSSNTAQGLQQLFGDVWEWTSSPYTPYPRYRPPPGALGEYNGKFMCNQMVLRGGSCVTPETHIRRTYRNFLYPDARWQFTGIRLARDAG